VITVWKKVCGNVTPYFISYRVNETRSYYIQTSFGQVVSANPEPGRSRQLTVSVRVGKHERDNTHPLRSSRMYFGSMGAMGAAMPLDSHPDGIRQVLWSETAKQFNEARDNFAKVQSELAIKVETEDQSDDFSREKPVTHYEEPLKEGQFTLNVSEWSRGSAITRLFF
jgi:hypothetical protein